MLLSVSSWPFFLVLSTSPICAILARPLLLDPVVFELVVAALPSQLPPELPCPLCAWRSAGVLHSGGCQSAATSPDLSFGCECAIVWNCCLGSAPGAIHHFITLVKLCVIC